MSSRKNVLPPYALFSAVDISINQTSGQTDIGHIDNIGITLSWAGTSPVGSIVVECANQKATETATWVPLDFGSTIAVSGNAGTHTISINQNPFTRLRLRYVSTSGTGTLTAIISGKMV